MSNCEAPLTKRKGVPGNEPLGDIYIYICTHIIELDDGNIYRKALYLMVKTMVSCKFSLKPIQ